jgi:lipid-A-disaccharide synthase-like uncharacterized protein
MSVPQGPLLWWEILGWSGQALFFGRFFVQWLASERRKQSVVPDAFWYFSLGGGLVLLVYAIHRQEPVFVLGQAGGLVIYLRNVWLLRHRQPAARAD